MVRPPIGDDNIGLGLQCAGAFHFAHGGGDGGEFCGKGAAKTAASFGRAHLNQLKPAHFREQFARRTFDVQFAQTVAAVVKNYLVRKARAEIGDTEFADQKI